MFQNKKFSINTVQRSVFRYAKISGIALFVFAAFCLLPPAPTVDNEATAATTYLFTSAQTAPTLSLTTDKSSISITANPTSTLATGKVTNTVSTTNYAGYKLTANLSGTSTNLTHSTISSKNIPSITSSYTSSNFPTGYWGVSLDDTNYQALPASNATALQLKNQTAAATNQTVALTVGTKVNQNQANGNYTNTINLTATANAASYTITYDKNTTDTVSNLPSAQTGTVSASAVALSSNTPTRTGYTFLGWSESSSATSATFANGASVYFNQTQNNSSIKLYAVWKINTYTVTLNVASASNGFGSVNRSSLTVNYGSAVSISGATATVAGTATTATATTATAQYSYAFSSWTNNCGTTVTGNCTISANFTRTTRSYTVTFAVNTSGYGSLTRTSQASIPYGTAVSISGATATINSVTTTATATTATAQYSYAFSNWTNGCGTSVTGNCTITANFTRTTRSYTVTFAVNTAGYGTTSRSTQTVTYGGAVSTSGATATVAGTNTTATAATTTAQYSYAFSSWTNGCGSTVTGNCTITANFTRTTRSYTVTFTVNNSSYGTVSRSSQSVAYGGAVSISGATATVAGTATTATASSGYELQNWTNGCGATVTAACTITANFKESIRYMQDIATYKSSMVQGQQYQMIDQRDNKIYWVAKLAGGDIWMTQNLDYDLSITANQTLSPTTSDVSENVTISPTTVSRWNYIEGGEYYIKNDGSSTKYSIDCSVANVENCHYHIGNYYSFDVATIYGRGTTSITGSTPADLDTDYSICPKGWHIPKVPNYGAPYSPDLHTFKFLTESLDITYRSDRPTGNSDAALISSPYYFVRGGSGSSSDSTVYSLGFSGGYWSGTLYAEPYPESAHYLLHYSTYVNPRSDTNRKSALSVRCVSY